MEFRAKYWLTLALIVVMPAWCQAQYEALFFRIKHPENKAVSYLYATMSDLPAGWYKMPTEVEQALKASDVYISGELKPSSQKFVRDLEKASNYDVGKNLLNELDKVSKQAMQDYLNENIMPQAQSAQALRAKSGFTIEKLFPYLFETRSESVDQHLMRLATESKKLVKHLEYDEKRTIKAFEHYAATQEAESLPWVMHDLMHSRASWIYHYLNADFESFQKVYSEKPDLFARERSNFWTHQLVFELKSPSFVGIPYQHFFGEESLPFMLKLLGFEVEQIPLRSSAPAELSAFIEK
jgi:uncharacterized protein YbaP (TraB family)